MRRWCCTLLLVLLVSPCAAAEPEPAGFAAKLHTLDEQIEANPKDGDALARRAALYAAAGKPTEAIADYGRLLKLDPDRAEAYNQRGAEQFKLGHVNESIADFDRFIKLRPDEEAAHWMRGISYYYAGRFDEGRRQFEVYQTFDDNDVENAAWRYLCMARASGVPVARDAILKVKRDPRVPMAEIYGLYAGRLKPEDVLIAARGGSPSPAELNARLFYAHLYLGLYYEVAGDAKEAKRHLEAARQHKIGHYMWNVADVHARRLAGNP